MIGLELSLTVAAALFVIAGFGSGPLSARRDPARAMELKDVRPGPRQRLAAVGLALVLAPGAAVAGPVACAFEPLSDYMKITQHAPTDEGGSTISVVTGAAGHGASVTDVMVIDCASGHGADLGAEDGTGKPRSVGGRALTGFVAGERKAGRLVDIKALLVSAAGKGFETKRLQAASNSPVSICACTLYYPQVARDWAKRAAPNGVGAAY